MKVSDLSGEHFSDMDGESMMATTVHEAYEALEKENLVETGCGVDAAIAAALLSARDKKELRMNILFIIGELNIFRANLDA